MLAPVSVGLKFGFLIVLYLFLMWVAWSAMRDLRRGRGGVVRADERRRLRRHRHVPGRAAASAITTSTASSRG